jgi:lysophospholipase L1-like esterase
MNRKLLVASLILNVLLLGVMITGAVAPGELAKNFTRIGAERWRTQFDVFSGIRGATVFLGDSITEGAHWPEIFGDTRILNRGIGGDTTQDLLARIEQVYLLQPAQLFLMIGVNDLNLGVPAVTTQANFRALFDGFAAHLPQTRIHVQSVLPVSGSWMGAARNEDILELNEFLKRECAGRGYEYIDLHALLRDANGQLPPTLSNDGIHLLGDGYRLWRDAIADRVVLSNP